MKQIIQIKYVFAALIKVEKTKTSSEHKALRHGAPMAFYSDSSSQVPRNMLLSVRLNSISRWQLLHDMSSSVGCLPG